MKAPIVEITTLSEKVMIVEITEVGEKRNFHFSALLDLPKCSVGRRVAGWECHRKIKSLGGIKIK